ncbi:MAG: type II toxin-antitoxin system Phd/YefM family antitoxin [Candidatus Binataceae bacterium]
MSKVISIPIARAKFGRILREASEKNERFVVDRRGEPQAVILGIRDFIRTLAPPPGFMAELRAAARRQGLDQLSRAEIDREIAVVRRKRREPSSRKAAAK